MMRSAAALVLLLAAWTPGASAQQAGPSADTVADFYRGKTITFVNSSAAGGGMDIHARLVAPFLAEQIPGRPSIIIQNRTGAGGIVAANYLYNVAPKDGTVIGLVHSPVPFAPLLGEPGTQYDATKFNWIGSIDASAHLCISWHTAPARKFEDLFANKLLVGSTGPGSSMGTLPLLMNRFLGTQFNVVSGYKGGNDIYLAMERGEVHGRCVLTLNALRSIHPDWLKDGKINILLQLSRKPSPEPELRGVPVLYDYAKDDLQRGVLDILFANQEMERPVLAPPGVPAERVAALRAAFDAVMKDPKLRAQVEEKSMTMNSATGAAVADSVSNAYAAPRAVVEAAIKATQPAGK